jgi:hypothetical protein
MDRVNAGATIADGLARTHLTLSELWLRYFAVGGACSFQALAAYVRGDVDWSSREHDLAALALNEYFLDQGAHQSVGYSADLEYPW